MNVAVVGVQPMTWRAHLREMRRNPALFVWSLMLLLGPVYVFGSGMPQPGDWFVLLLAPLALSRWNGKLERRASQCMKALLVFTVWVCIVNYGWAAILWKWTSLMDFVLPPFFYIFNAFVFLSAIVVSRRDPERFLRITVDIIFVTIIACVVSSFTSSDLRVTGFFNGPNQLGYYALLSACLFALVQRPLRLSRVKASLGVVACAYLALVSASRASLAGILILLVVLLFSNPKLIITGLLASIGVLSIAEGTISKSLEFNEKRAVENRGETFAEERGYDRIWRFPQHLVFGAGEGAYERFARPGTHMRELHSSFGSVLFSYGTIGVGFFLWFFIRVVRGAPLRAMLLLVPVLAYTVAHQGLRFTMFWVVLVAFLVFKSLPESPRGRAAAKA